MIEHRAYRFAERDRVPGAEEMNVLLLKLMRGVNAQLFTMLGNKVVAGPFKGMEIPQEPVWDDGNSGTKLLGAYEFELADAWTKAASRNPKVIVNVGCAEGYYAVGLARMIPEARVYAFDIDEDSLVMCANYARRNGVGDRVRIRKGAKNPMEMIVGKLGHRLYVLDCEAAEFELLDKEKCPDLIKADIVVECHEFLHPGLTDAIARRFLDTHHVEIMQPQLPDYRNYPFLVSAPAVMLVLAVTEKRPLPTAWLMCWAK